MRGWRPATTQLTQGQHGANRKGRRYQSVVKAFEADKLLVACVVRNFGRWHRCKTRSKNSAHSFPLQTLAYGKTIFNKKFAVLILNLNQSFLWSIF